MQTPYYLITFERDRKWEERKQKDRDMAELMARTLRRQFPDIGFITVHEITDEDERGELISDDF